MWKEFFKFDVDYQLRQPLLWVCALVMAALAFTITTIDEAGGGNVFRNAPTVIASQFAFFSMLSMLVVTIFIAGTVLRDSEVGISDMLFATPMRKRDYLIGRFGAGLVACMIVFCVIAVGLMLGPLMPWVDAQKVGPFAGYAYLWSMAVIVLPNLLFIGALLMLLASTTRSMMMVYVGVVAFFVLYIVTGTLVKDVNNDWVAVLLDPFGGRAMGFITRYYSAAEKNAGLPPLAGYLLANRLLWSAIAVAMMAATVMLFKPQRAGTGKRLFGKAKVLPVQVAASAPRALPRIEPRITGGTAWSQLRHIFLFDAAGVFKSVPFLVLLLIAVGLLIGGSYSMGSMYGTDVYPVTYMMVQLMVGVFTFMLLIILTFYAGELIFKEREAKISDVHDAMPVPNWVPLLAKSAALICVIVAFLAAGALVSMVIQLIKGGVPLEPLLYLKGVSLSAMPFVLMGLCAVALQIFSNNKFIGYLLMIIVILVPMALSMLHLDHNLYNFASVPSMPYSDMNGLGHFLKGWSWFAAYWSIFTLGLMIVAQAFWVRGLSVERRARMALARQRLKGASGLALTACVIAFAATGGWIFYNTNVLNDYEATDVTRDKLASYEKLYRQYKDLPQAKITDIEAAVDIFPAERRVVIKGSYALQNKTDKPIDQLRLQVNPDIELAWTTLPAHQVVLADKKLGFSILKLTTPLAPGATTSLGFVVKVINEGFTNKNGPDQINLNGTFFENGSFFPHLGYQAGFELTDRHERKKRGLGEPERMPKLENVAARANTVFGAEADWVNFDTVVSTSSDQTAMAPGYLQKSWEKDGRRYFHYKMDRKILPFFSYQSARYEVKKAHWNGLPIEVYYDKKHGYNVERMIDSTKKSLDYMSTHFTPYQHKQVRILEFPAYRQFAQAFANTIPYSEGMGFIADLRKEDAIDYVFFVTAHELAHQWWAHQVIGAGVQGSSMLSESLAEYSALMVMEKEYGPAKLRRFLRYELDRYLSERSGELLEEQPLYRVENQPYIHYRKGALVFYRLRDELGEAALNRALKRFLQDKGYQQAPFTTSAELLQYIRAEAPPEKQNLITDLFERIVFYDNRVTDAKAVKRADGKWNVTFKLHLSKVQVDGKGKETPRAYDEPVEIAVFARAEGAKEKDERLLVSEKRVLAGSDPTVTITVDEKPFEVGVDPYNKMIDRVPRDNRKEVSVD